MKRVTVDDKDPEVFGFHQEVVEPNVIPYVP
jgi:hypothetical protein